MIFLIDCFLTNAGKYCEGIRFTQQEILRSVRVLFSQSKKRGATYHSSTGAERRLAFDVKGETLN